MNIIPLSNVPRVMRQACRLQPEFPIRNWIPPDADSIESNADASFLSESGRGCAGVVAGNCRGEIILSVSGSTRVCSSVEEAEAFGVRIGLEVLPTVYQGPVMIDTHCARVVKELRSDVVSARLHTNN